VKWPHPKSKLFVAVGSHNVIDFRPKKKETVMAPIKATEEVILVIGQAGSDGGYSVLTPQGIRKVPSNNPEARAAFDAVAKSFATLQAIAVKAQVGQKVG
jgi:hypothetical protein